MRSVYAVQFEVESLSPEPVKPVMAEVRETVREWIADWYQLQGSHISLPATGEVSPLQGHSIFIDVADSRTSDISHTEVTWSYPDESDQTLLWQTSCEISHYHGSTEFSLELMIDSAQFVIEPVFFSLGRPRLVRTLLDTFACTMGAHSLKPQLQP